jgi:hypothetical protein
MRFFGECCFQDIYFVSNIFILSPAAERPPDLAETCRLARAANNARVNRGFAGFLQEI